jgi:RNA polymerase sigma-70 factor (ECF subfamily)
VDEFEAMVAPHVGALRSYLTRLVANASDADDLVQDALVQAHRKLAEFRGDSSFKTWLFAIATRLGLTHLRTRKRWPVTTQLETHERCHRDPAFLAKLGGELAQPEFRYEVAEHVAYCFACVGRMLEPDVSAAVLLVEVFGLAASEAAKALDVTESVLRHKLAAGRREMTDAFDGLCALVNKGGACHQCSELREVSPPDRRGDAPPDLSGDLKRRLAIVRDADAVGGPTARLHKLMLGFIAEHAD